MKLPSATVILLASAVTVISSAIHVRTTGKRGIAFADNADPQDINLFKGSSKITWVYNWSPTPTSYFSGLQFYPMQWNGAGIQNLAAEVAALHAPALLAFNEPDNAGQSNMDPTYAAQLWVQYIQPIQKIGVLLGAPAVTNAPSGAAWLRTFFSACTGCKVDFLPIHWYGEGIGNFYDYIWSMYGEFGLPVWVTEFADTSSDEPTVANFLQSSIQYMDTLDWVQKYSWFGMFRNTSSSPSPYAMLTSDGKLNQLGTLYLTS